LGKGIAGLGQVGLEITPGAEGFAGALAGEVPGQLLALMEEAVPGLGLSAEGAADGEGSARGLAVLEGDQRLADRAQGAQVAAEAPVDREHRDRPAQSDHAEPRLRLPAGDP
jgi:hypothetical protein